MCNLGSLNCSNSFVEKLSESNNLWRMDCNEDDMCQIDKDDSMVSKVRLCSASMIDNVNQVITMLFSRVRYFNHLSVTAPN